VSDRVFDFPNVKERPELPLGVFDFAVEGFTERIVGQGKLSAISGSMRVIGSDGDAQNNLPWSELYTLGSEGDPEGMDPAKLNDTPGMRGLKRLARACGIDVDQRWSQSALLNAILAQPKFTGHIGSSTSKKDGKVYTQLDRYYKYQEVPVKLDGPARAAGATARPNGPAGHPVTVARPTATVATAAPAAELPAGFAIEE
jgi:hypothetical protein